MNMEQTKSVIDYISATWPGELTEDRIAVWVETLADIKPAYAREALRDLKRVKTFTPTHADFYEAVQVIVDRIAVEEEERELGEPGGTRCPNDCVDGWVEIDRIGQGHVERCDRCNPRPDPKAEHPERCSCGRCHYGPKRAAAIRGGYDGMTQRKKPLEPVGAPPPEEEF